MTERIAIVTGGLAGIGLAISQHLIEAGIKVAIGQRDVTSPERLDKAKELLDGNFFAHPLDVKSETSVKEFIEAVEQELGSADILVNSAGVGIQRTVSRHSLEEWNSVIETNLTGPFLMSRACLPSMKEQKWGRIINIASTAATAAMPDYPAYCASKSGLLGLTRAVALEGAPHGVSCLAVSPTWVETDMLHKSAKASAKHNGTKYEEELESIKQANPQNRLVHANEIASLVTFLCGETAPALTMEDIQVNAGAYW